MRTRSSTRVGLAALAIALAGAGCENEFSLDEPARFAPPQASVVTENGTITVFWTGMEDASGYRVLVSETSDKAGLAADCSGQGENEHVSPCLIENKTPGQLYYVRVKSFAADGGTNHDPDDEDLPSLAVRAGFPGLPRTPFVWAGVGVLQEGEQNHTVYLSGMWFEDGAAPDAVHACHTYDWSDGVELELDPCTSEDLTFTNFESAAQLGGECKEPVCYPVLEVEADDGRRGQAYTRVVGRP